MRFENFERSTQIIGGALRVPRILDKQINQLLKAQTCISALVYILYGNLTLLMCRKRKLENFATSQKQKSIVTKSFLNVISHL